MSKPEDFNRKIALQQKAVEFFYDDTHPFSNVFPARVFFNGVDFPSSEHAYQAQKFDPVNAWDIFEEIMNTSDPVEAKHIADANSDRTRADWSYITKFRVMTEIVYQKMIQNPAIAALLIKSYPKMLVEDAPQDNCWGMVTTDEIVSGSNFIGRILMSVRNRLINEG